MAFGFENEPLGINILGGVKVNQLSGNATLQIGESLWQSLHNSTKTNTMGSIYGDFDTTNIQPIASPIFDPDGVDSLVPAVTSPYGLED